MPNPNNYINLSAGEFIEILEGRNQYYSRPQRSNPRISLDISNRALVASGKEPICYINLPTSDLRQEQWRNHLVYSTQYTAENRPDPKEPLIYRINESVIWNRGINESTGEGEKEELICNINLLGCEFTDSLYMTNIKSRSSFYSISSTFKKSQDSQFIIAKCVFKDIHLIDYRTQDSENKPSIKKIVISDLKAEELLISSMIVEELVIQGKEGLIKKLSIVNCVINTLILGDTEIEDISVLNTSVSNHLTLSANLKKFYFVGKELHADKVQHVNQLNISQNDQASKSEYFIKNSYFAHVKIDGTIDGKLLLTESEINDLVFDELTNVGEFRLNNIKGVNRLSINYSSMGKAEFLNIDLKNNNFLQVVNSNLLDIVLINTVFSKSLIGNSENDFRGKRDAFRQLKFASGKQGNRIQELMYEAFEMEAYQKDNETVKSRDERIILYLNWLTNNYGQSWSKALICLLITIPLFVFVKCSFGYTLGWGLDSEEMGQYLEFALNPLHNFDILFKKEIVFNSSAIGYAKIIDILSKIVSGFILFQLVRAFRKYVK